MKNRENSILDLFNQHRGILEKYCRRETFPAGAYLFREGETGDTAYIIERGEIVVSRTLDGREKAIAVTGVGEIVGEIALFSGNPRTATAHTNAELKAIILTRECFQRLKVDAPSVVVEMYERILQIVTGRLHGAIDHYEVIYHLLT